MAFRLRANQKCSISWAMSGTPSSLLMLWLLLQVLSNGHAQPDERMLDVLVQLQTNTGQTTEEQLQHLRQHYHVDYRLGELRRTHAVPLRVPASQLEALQQDTDTVVTVEDDPIMMPFEHNNQQKRRKLNQVDQETIPWGLADIQALSHNIPRPPPGADCFRICTVDAGLSLAHPDIPWSSPSSSVWGREFGLPPNQTWYNPKYNHGTHTAGIMVATPYNGIGIRGAWGESVQDDVCMLVARVFPDSGRGNYDSVILTAVEWCADNGARVISLSLGSPLAGTTIAKDLYDSLYSDDILVISASGNDYDGTKNFPASFESVLSVAAIDANGNRGKFSCYNDQVNIAAPGVAINSTVPIRAIADENGRLHEYRYMEHAQEYQHPLSGRIQYCGTGKSDFDFDNVQGRICLIRRGGGLFQDTSLKCQQNGGVGAIIFNNATGDFRGRITEGGGVHIPVVSVTLKSGTALMQSGQVTLTESAGGYEAKSGTSMAVPYVSAIAAKIWAANPLCSQEQVRNALLSSAKTWGLFPGRDAENRDIDFAHAFGEGLVQAQAAYNALNRMPYPCGGRTVDTTRLSAPTPRPILLSEPQVLPSWSVTTVVTPAAPTNVVVLSPVVVLPPPTENNGSWSTRWFEFGRSSSQQPLTPPRSPLNSVPAPTPPTGSYFHWQGVAGNGGFRRSLRGWGSETEEYGYVS